MDRRVNGPTWSPSSRLTSLPSYNLIRTAILLRFRYFYDIRYFSWKSMHEYLSRKLFDTNWIVNYHIGWPIRPTQQRQYTPRSHQLVTIRYENLLLQLEVLHSWRWRRLEGVCHLLLEDNFEFSYLGPSWSAQSSRRHHIRWGPHQRPSVIEAGKVRYDMTPVKPRCGNGSDEELTALKS